MMEAYQRNMEGETVGLLTVLSEDKKKSTRKNKRYWCLCHCGRKISVSNKDLRNGYKTSCGECETVGRCPECGVVVELPCVLCSVKKHLFHDEQNETEEEYQPDFFESDSSIDAEYKERYLKVKEYKDKNFLTTKGTARKSRKKGDKVE